MFRNIFKFLAVVLLLILFAFTQNSWAQLTGTKNIPGDFTTLAQAIDTLNALGVGSGGVTFNLLAGNPETAPVGGYSITSLTGSSSNQIIIQGNGNTITAFAPQTEGSTSDAIFKIIGGDYITIQGFTLQENAGDTVITPVLSNTMTEFGVLLVHVSATDGCQYNTIQNNIISLNSSYPNSVGVFSTSASSPAFTALDATSIAGTNSNNKVYGNTISNVAYGIYFICPPTTATVFETGNDIGGSALSTGNTITFGCDTSITATNWNRSTTTTIIGGIYFRNGFGNNVRFNSVTSNALAYAQTSVLGGIVLSASASPTGVTYTTTFSDNTINLTNIGTVTGTYGVDFGSSIGVSTGAIVANNNNITITQNSIAAVSYTLVGIRAANISSTNTLNNNTVTINQNPENTGSVTCAVTGITAAGVGTTVNVNNNIITFKQATPGGTATYGSGAITYINVSAGSGNVNVNSNQLLTTGSTIRSTGTCVGVSHTSGTITVGLTINLNTINIDRVAGSGTITGTDESTSPNTIAHTITNNSITFTSLSGGTTANGIATLGGNGAGTVNAINGNTIIISGTHIGNSIGIQTESSLGNMNNNSVTISSAGPDLVAYKVEDASEYTIAGNSVSLTSSTTSPNSMMGFNLVSTGNCHVYNNTFTAMNFTGIITGSPWIAGINCSITITIGASNIYDNIITNITVGAPTSSANPTVSGIVISRGPSINVYRNKIYGIVSNCTGTTGVVNGILLPYGGTKKTIYNNLIADISAPASASVDAIRGISITYDYSNTTNNIYYNNIFLDASSTGANFGTSGIYHIATISAYKFKT